MWSMPVCSETWLTRSAASLQITMDSVKAGEPAAPGIRRADLEDPIELRQPLD
jgi:hypothetical protein